MQILQIPNLRNLPNLTFSRILGEGNYTKVYEFLRSEDKVPVAVKVYEEEDADQAFIREFYALSRINHPHIISLTTYFLTPDANYLAFEKMDRDLETILRKEIHFPHRKEILFQILTALAYLHSNGMIHRDIKPDNVMISFSPLRAVLIDLGMTRHDYHNPTLHTSVVFALWYRPPELLNCENGTTTVTPAVDIWAYGCLVAEWFMGKSLFRGEEEEEVRHQISSLHLPGRKDILQKMGEDGLDLLSQLLQKDPSKRITARDALLHPFFEGRTPPMEMEIVSTPLTTSHLTGPWRVEIIENALGSFLSDPKFPLSAIICAIQIADYYSQSTGIGCNSPVSELMDLFNVALNISSSLFVYYPLTLEELEEEEGHLRKVRCHVLEHGVKGKNLNSPLSYFRDYEKEKRRRAHLHTLSIVAITFIAPDQLPTIVDELLKKGVNPINPFSSSRYWRV